QRRRAPEDELRWGLVRSRLDANALAEDRVGRDPPVDAPAVVADLEPLPLDRLDEVQVLAPFDLAEYDVADLQRRRIDRHHRADLARLALPRHRMATRAKRRRLARAQFLDMTGGPTHAIPSDSRGHAGLRRTADGR